MTFTTQQLFEVFKKKISNQDKADLLGISLEEYNEVKLKILEALDSHNEKINYVYVEALDNTFNKNSIITTTDSPFYKVIEINENVENGTKKITSLSSSEPKSAEEIIQLLKIDTNKWKLSQYWNKEKSGGWEISALVTKITEQPIDFKLSLKDIEVKPIPPYTFKIKSRLDPACGVISLQDLHFGKPGNNNINELVEESLNYLLSKAIRNYKLTDVYLILGGDILNVDTFSGTTTSGTIVSNEKTPMENYQDAFKTMVEVIKLIKQTCDTLHVIYIPGNHDRLSSFHLLHALNQAFKEWKEVKFDSEYSERKVKKYGNSMLCFEHGDAKQNKNPLIYATEFPTIWGETKFRKLFLGHLHYKKTKEYVTENEECGFTTKILPSLSATDYWHYHNKYTGSKRSAVLEIIDPEKGTVAEYVHCI